MNPEVSNQVIMSAIDGDAPYLFIHCFEASFMELPEEFKEDVKNLALLIEAKYPEAVFGKYYAETLIPSFSESRNSKTCKDFPYLEFKFLRQREDGSIQFHGCMRIDGRRRNTWVSIGKYAVNLTDLATIPHCPRPTLSDLRERRVNFQLEYWSLKPNTP